MRLHYRNGDTSGYFHTLRAATRNPEDDGKGGLESIKNRWNASAQLLTQMSFPLSDTLQCIAEMLRITKQSVGLDLLVVEKRLER